jgi:hypothetical protein
MPLVMTFHFHHSLVRLVLLAIITISEILLIILLISTVVSLMLILMGRLSNRSTVILENSASGTPIVEVLMTVHHLALLVWLPHLAVPHLALMLRL